MGRRDDLERHIRDSYAIISQYEDIIATSSDPKEQARAQRNVDEQWELIKRYLSEYRTLCQRLGREPAEDIVEIEVALEASAPDLSARTEVIASAAAGPVYHIDTGGGAVVLGDVSTAGGEFVGRDRREARAPQPTASIASPGMAPIGDAQTSIAPEQRQREVASLRARLDQARENLLLIRERKGEYVMETDIPLDLIKRERQLERQIADLETQLSTL